MNKAIQTIAIGAALVAAMAGLESSFRNGWAGEAAALVMGPRGDAPLETAPLWHGEQCEQVDGRDLWGELPGDLWGCKAIRRTR